MNADYLIPGERDNLFTYIGSITNPAQRIARPGITTPLWYYLRRRDWIGIIGSPQSGRTTLLHQIREMMTNTIYFNFAGADFNSIQDLWVDFAERVGPPSHIGDSVPTLPVRGSRVLQTLERPGGLVWLIDDLTHTPKRKLLIDFLIAVRGYYSERSMRPQDNSHVFVFADSTDLSKISLGLGGTFFNVLQKLYLTDFDQKDVEDFLARRAGGAFSPRSAECVFQYTGGHPCLVQFVCDQVFDPSKDIVESRLQNQTSLIDAASAAGLPNIRKALEPLSDESEGTRRCAAVIERILGGERIPFRPSEPTIEDLVFRYGVIRDEAGSCAIRNPIYQALLQSSLDIRKAARPQEAKVASLLARAPTAALDEDETTVLSILGQEGRMSLPSLSVKALISPRQLEMALQRLKNKRHITERNERSSGERLFALY